MKLTVFLCLYFTYLLSGAKVRSPSKNWCLFNLQTSKGLVSKETVVLRRWGRETQNFGFIIWQREKQE